MELKSVWTKYRKSAEPDLTPILDCVFLLVIFFMVVNSISTIIGITIKIPKDPGDQPVDDEQLPANNIVATIYADDIGFDHKIKLERGVKINDEWADWKDIVKKVEKKIDELGKKPLIVQGQEKTHHGKIIKVMDLAQTAGINGFSFAPPKE